MSRSRITLRGAAFLLFLIAASAWILLKPAPLQTDEGKVGDVAYHITYRAKLSHRSAIEQELLRLQHTLPPMADTAFTRQAGQSIRQLLYRQKASGCDIRLTRSARH